ncbi:N-acetyltransferase [Dehalococcoidia bacterium]|nr:N-acetyltransferase [Dehalococcoidia bacterium]
MRVEKAKIADVPQIHKLVNYFASQGQMLPRSLSEIYENLRDFFVVREGEEVAACVALHICWHDLVEIKSLAVAEEQQDAGLGTALVKECIEEARGLGVPTVFCLTYQPAFFEQFGFSRIGLMELPRKIWGECQRCPKYPDCDETAMVLHLKPSAKLQW